MEIMNTLTILVLVLVPVITVILKHVVDSARDKKPETLARNQAKEAEFTALLQDGETIRAICQTHTKCYSAVTERALLTEDKAGIHRIAFGKIKKIKFLGPSGETAHTADHVMMIKLVDMDGNKYSLYKYSEKMIDLAGVLMAKVG